MSSDGLSGLLHEVRDAAGLSVDEETIATAVRMGHGSARDALSALDQVLATGSIADAQPPFDELLGALASSDAVTAIGAQFMLVILVILGSEFFILGSLRRRQKGLTAKLSGPL